jgi:hypothetical protein
MNDAFGYGLVELVIKTFAMTTLLFLGLWKFWEMIRK